jgi:hypothetical protein
MADPTLRVFTAICTVQIERFDDCPFQTFHTVEAFDQDEAGDIALMELAQRFGRVSLNGWL